MIGFECFFLFEHQIRAYIKPIKKKKSSKLLFDELNNLSSLGYNFGCLNQSLNLFKLFLTCVKFTLSFHAVN